jgi:Intracellular proteinase inhibitor
MTRRTRLNLEILEGRSLLSALAYSLTTNQSTYEPGQPIEMTFSETNESGRSISVGEGPSIDGFNVTQDGTTVWRSNAGANPMYILLKTLAPGQSLTLTATWNGIPTGGSSPMSGQFVITNQLNPEGARATATITAPGSTPPSSTGQQPTTPTTPTPAPVAPIVTDPAPVSTPVGTAPISVPSPTPTPGGSQTTPPTTGSVPDPSPVALSIGMNHPTYRKGHPVRMTATLHNAGDSAVQLTPNSSADGFTLLEGSTVVWHTARTDSGTLKPGHSVKLTAVWNGRLHQPGATLAPGTYTIEAVEGNDSGSSTFRITA